MHGGGRRGRKGGGGVRASGMGRHAGCNGAAADPGPGLRQALLTDGRMQRPSAGGPDRGARQAARGSLRGRRGGGELAVGEWAVSAASATGARAVVGTGGKLSSGCSHAWRLPEARGPEGRLAGAAVLGRLQSEWAMHDAPGACAAASDQRSRRRHTATGLAPAPAMRVSPGPRDRRLDKAEKLRRASQQPRRGHRLA